MKSNRSKISLLFFSLVVVMMGFGMVIPLLPFLIDAFNANASALGALMAIYAAAQFIFAPIWGQVSDRIGRKPVLLIGVLGNAISQIMFGLATNFATLFIARALAGILSSATLPTAMAYISDSTSEEERGGGMGIMGAAMGVGMVIGPGLGGWLGKDSLSTPFFIAAGLSVLALILIAITLPESLAPEARTTGGKIELTAQFRGMRAAIFGPIGFLLLLAFLVSFGMTNFESVFGLFALHRFEYGPREVGLILMFIGVISAIVQGALTGPATKRWGESLVIKATMLLSALAFVLMLSAFNLLALLLTVGFFIFSNSMIRPAVSSLTSKRATIGQGEAMGWNNAFMSLGRVAGPLAAGVLFDVNIQFPYLMGGLVLLVGGMMCLFLLRGVPKPAEQMQVAD
jgi:DHA1 family multidrug resistance protein-like MFS transporter